jgi:hypothetical protein
MRHCDDASGCPIVQPRYGSKKRFVVILGSRRTASLVPDYFNVEGNFALRRNYVDASFPVLAFVTQLKALCEENLAKALLGCLV